MSLINDMLRDLQARQVLDGLLFADLEPVSHDEDRSLQARLGATLIAFALALPLYFISGSLGEKDSNEPMASSVIEPAPAARAERHAGKEESSTTPPAPKPAPSTSEPATPPAKKVARAVRADDAPASPAVDSSAAPGKKTSAAPRARKAAAPVVATTAAKPVAVATDAVSSRSAPTSGAVMRKSPANSVAKAGEQTLRDVLVRDPEDSADWMRLYETLLDRDEAEAAQAAMIEGLATAAEPSPLASRYARELIVRGDLDQARSVLQEYRPVASFDQDYEALLAWLLQSTEHHREAADAYRTLVAWNSQFGDWWVGLAISLENIGDREGALQAYQQARDAAQIKSTLARYASQRIAALNADG